MNCVSPGAQILKQAELRELRKLDERAAPSYGRRASRPLEAKWRLTIPRSPLCEGCGVRTVPAAEGSAGSKAWKCGPCVRAIEEVPALPARQPLRARGLCAARTVSLQSVRARPSANLH